MKKFYTAIANCKKITIAFLAVLFCLIMRPEMGFGQTVVMSNADQTSVCTGTYYDPGGTSNYSNNVDRKQTFTPSAGNRMSFNFTSFNTEFNYDFLYIYDGNSISAPLIGKYSGNGGLSGIISSTADDGSLTFVFHSDGGTTKPGWAAAISCVSVPYRATFTSLDLTEGGSKSATSWCANETRNVLVTVKNTGTSAWTSGATGVNLSYWFTPGQNRDYNGHRQPFSNLLPNNSQTISIPITAPASGPLVLNFDLVKETFCWFADNVAGCSGPGNLAYSSSSITISALPGVPTATSPQSFCGSGTVAGLSITSGTNIKWYDAATGGNLLAPATALINGNHYYASQTNASGCESALRKDVTVNLNPNPTTAAAGPDQTDATTCGLTTVNLAANTPIVGTGAWSIISGAGGSFGTLSNPASTFTGVAGTAYTLRWTISSGSCTSADDVNITFNRNPTVSNAGPDQVASACTQTTLAANPATTGTGAWSIISGTGGSVTTPASPTSTFTGVPGTVYILRWTISNSPCTASTDDVQVNFTAAPTTANAGPDQTDAATCGLTSVTLAGNPATVGTGAWSIISGAGGSVATPSSPTSPFSGVAGSTYTLRWTITNLPCTSADDVVITFNQNPVTANAGPDQTGAATCGLTTVALSGNAAAPGTGAWSIISGTGGSVATASNATSNFTGTAGVTYTLRWTITNPCGSTSDDVVITFNKNVTAANAGADQTGASTCGLTTVTLAANNPASGIGAWTIISGAGGNVTTPASFNSTFTGTAGTSYTLRWTITNSPCASSSDDVVITFNQPPTVSNAGPDQTDAATCGLTSVTLAGNTATIGTGAWSIVSGLGGSVATASNPASTFTGTAGTTYTLRWTISNSQCTASTDDVVITFNRNPSTANAGPDQTSIATCGSTSVTLAATAPTVGTGAWSIVSGTGGNVTTPASRTSTFTGVAGNTYTLRWTVSNAPCAASTDDVVITFNQAPTAANAGPDQNGAATCGLTSVTLAANNPAIGSGAWSIVSGTGGSVTTIASNTSTFTGTAGSTYTLRWTVTNGICSSTDDVTIKFNQNPTVANAGPDQTGTATCGLTSVSLNGNAPSVGIGAWSKISGAGGGFSNTANRNATFTGTAGVSYVLRWTITNSPCSASSDDMSVTFNVNPTAGAITQANSLNSVCVNGTLPLTSNGSAGTVVWNSSNGSVASVDNSGVVTGLVAGNTNISYTVTSASGCTTTSNNYPVSVLQIPSGTLNVTENSGTTQDDKIICLGDPVTFTFSTAGLGSYVFKVNGIIKQPGTSNVFSTSSLTGGETVTVDVSNSLSCGATFTAPAVMVNPLPAPTLTVTENSGGQNDNTICPNSPVTLTATPANAASTYTFIINGAAVITSSSNTYIASGIISNSTVAVTETNSNGCQTTTANQNITVSPVPTGALTSVPSKTATTASICDGDNITFTATLGYASYEFFVNSVSQGVISGNTFTPTTLANPSVVTVKVTNTNGCTSTFNTIAVTVNPLPTGTIAITENSGSQNNNEICAGSAVTYTFSNATYTTYEWQINGITKPSTGNIFTTTDLLHTSDVVTVIVTSGSGCTATFNAATVTVVPAPTGILSVSLSNNICNGDNVVFTVLPLDPTFTYTFKVDGTIVKSGLGDNTFTTNALAVGTYPVTVDVTNSSSCVTTSNAISMTVNPLPTSTVIPMENYGAADDGTICQGGTVIFTVPAGYTNYNFLLNGNTVQTGSSRTFDNSVYSITLATGDKLTVAITNAGGCIGFTNEVIITVNPLPVVDPIGGGATNVCLNSATNAFTNTTSGGVWSVTNGTGSASITSGGVATGLTAGSVTINYSVTNGNGCSTTVTKILMVNAPPVVDPITGNVNICATTTSQFSDATPDGTWSSDNIAVATVDAITGLVTGLTSGTANIKYTVTDGNGCSTTVTTVVTVSNFPAIAPITTSSSSGFNVCIGGLLTLANATTGGVWKSSDITVATVSAAGVVTGLSAGTTDITYSVTTTCSNASVATKTVTVNAPPSATIAYSGTAYCTNGGPITVVSQTGTTGGTYTITGGLTIDPSTGTITPGATGGAYTVTYTVAASGGCGIFTTTASVTITTAPSATISYAGPYCSTTTSANVTRTGTAGGTYTVTPAGLSINSTTGAIAPISSTAGGYTITYTIAASGGCDLFSTTTPVTITAAPSAIISYAGTPFCKSLATAGVTFSGTVGGTYSSTTGLTINGATGVITPTSSIPGIYTVSYIVAAAGGCSSYTATTSVTVTAAPTAVAGSNFATCSNNPPVNITGGSSATNYATILWSSSGTGTFVNQGDLMTATYTPSAADILAGSVTLTLTANGNSGCATPATSTKVLTISAPPAAFTITPASASICQGTVQSLTATANTSAPGTFTKGTGTVNINIPDASIFGAGTPVGSSIAVSGIPAGAVINNISVNMDIDHSATGDLILNLTDPNGNTLNLMDQDGGDGDNITNTTITSLSVLPVSGNNPITGIFAPDAANAGSPFPTTNAFTSLYGLPNGNWTLTAQDVRLFRGFLQTNSGKITDWTLTINYTIPNTPLAVTWTPLTDLYTDPGATASYTGTGLSTVYLKPASSGVKTYRATTTVGLCSTTQDVTVTVNPTPVVTITADYCIIPGKVVLTAISVPAATSYIWSTGSTNDTTQVDVAGNYSVTVFAGSTCPGKTTISVANELVSNGNFDGGNINFTTGYTYSNSTPNCGAATGGLYAAGTYNVTTSGQLTHCNFWGHDHTTGNGNFMLVNGSGASSKVWQQTVSVQPGTKYYFSAWAMSLNSNNGTGGVNNAKLQFAINGTPIGTTATLTNHGENSTAPDNWTRFYSPTPWQAGPTTTSILLTIIDLQTASGGNDFGLDDISFGTLSTFVNLVSDPITDAQTVCVNTPIQDIVYYAGSNGSSPTVTGLPDGVTPLWNGINLTLSGSPTIPGDYSYTITTTGSCLPSTATGTIKVQAQTIALATGSASSPSVCVNTPVSIAFTLSGTATGATVSGLPVTITGAVTGSGPTYTYTLSGTPIVAGIYPYTITTSGTCAPVTFSGTITVTSQTITLNSLPATKNQSVCIGAPIDNIQYTIGGTGTGVVLPITNLPAGVVGTFNSGILFISGTPTVSGTFNYTVTTSGTCAAVTATGTIIVRPNGSLTLTSGAGTNIQTTCINTAIPAISYKINDATGYTITGLPAGVSGGSVDGGGNFSINGAPTAPAGIYNYTITTTGGCGSGTATGSITVQSQTIVLTSGTASPSVCINTTLFPNIVYTIGGSATGAVVTGLPGGMGFTVAGNTVTISGAPNTTVGSPFTYVVSVSGTCTTPVSATGMITVNAAATGGTLPPLSSICRGSGITLTVQGSVGSILGWESSTDNFVSVITPITNPSVTLILTNIQKPTQYRAVVSNNCGSVRSSVANVGIHNYWTGASNTSDWNTAGNWADNQLPSATCAAVYIAPAPFQPIILTGAIQVNDLEILTGGLLTVTSATLKVTGNITSVNGINAATGTIELNGSATQSISGDYFANNKVKNLTISNNVNVTTVAGIDTLKIAGELSFNATGKTFAAGSHNVTLLSSLTATANVADLSGNTVSGTNFTVERYINTGIITGVNHGKSWELLSTPTKGQSIQEAWQEGQTSNANLRPGYGTQITSPNYPNGFDASTPGNSIKKYNSSTDQYDALASTTVPKGFYDERGYYMYVRGDRSVTAALGNAANPTVLRNTGTLNMGTQLPIDVPANRYSTVGNPYASPIDLVKMHENGGFNNTTNDLYLWDPSFGGVYGAGAFLNLTWRDNILGYQINATSPNYPSKFVNTIQSGQAFFVKSNGVASTTVLFKESQKSSSDSVRNVNGISAPIEILTATLSTNPAGVSATVLDGAIAIFGEDYSNNVDWQDGNKVNNGTNNVSFTRNGKSLVVERRQSPEAGDTLHLNLSSTNKALPYHWQFSAENMDRVPGRTAYLWDRFLNTKTTLNLNSTTDVDFTITSVAASAAADRFKIVFGIAKPLPVTITTVKATRNTDKTITVNWKVENEINIVNYSIERSADGVTFSNIGTTPPANSNGNTGSYDYGDVNPLSTANYYRIKALSKDGQVQYSNVVKVNPLTIPGTITVYPNPVQNKEVNMLFVNEPAGTYQLELTNKIGQVVYKGKVTISTVNEKKKVSLVYVTAAGVYHLNIKGPDGTMHTLELVVEL